MRYISRKSPPMSFSEVDCTDVLEWSSRDSDVLATHPKHDSNRPVAARSGFAEQRLLRSDSGLLGSGAERSYCATLRTFRTPRYRPTACRRRGRRSTAAIGQPPAAAAPCAPPRRQYPARPARSAPSPRPACTGACNSSSVDAAVSMKVCAPLAPHRYTPSSTRQCRDLRKIDKFCSQ